MYLLNDLKRRHASQYLSDYGFVDFKNWIKTAMVLPFLSFLSITLALVHMRCSGEFPVLWQESMMDTFIKNDIKRDINVGSSDLKKFSIKVENVKPTLFR